MKRWLSWVGAATGVMLLLATGLAWFVGETTTGLNRLVAAVNAAQIGKTRIHIEQAHGTLVDGFDVGEVRVSTETVDVAVSTIAGSVDFWRLVSGTIALDRLSVGRVRIALHRHEATAAATGSVKFLPRVLRLRVRSLDVRDVDILLANGTHLACDRITAQTRLAADSIAVSEFVLHAQLMNGNGRVSVLATEPLTLDADVEWSFNPTHEPAWHGRTSVKGDLDRLVYGADILAPFRASSRGELATLTKSWRWHGTLAIADFDVKAWKPDATLGPVAATLDVGGGHDGFFASGKLTPRDMATGPLKVRYRGTYHDQTLFFHELAIGPAGEAGEALAHGTIALTGGAPHLDVTADWHALQWPLRGTPTIASARGHAQLSGTWPLRWEIAASMRVRDLPAADLQAVGEIATGRITLTDVRGSWLDGKIGARGEVRYGEASGWSVTAQGTQLNPAGWRASWPGALDFAVRAESPSLKSDAKWQVDVDRVRGRLRGQSLAASGSLRRLDQGLGFERVALDLGSTHLRLDGSIAQEIALRWTLSSPDLAKTIPGAAGRLDSQGRLRGTAAAFAVSGHVDASGLKYSGFSAQRLLADLDVDLVHHAPFKATVAADVVKWSGYGLDALRLELTGTMDAHEWSLSARRAETRMQLGGHGHYAPRLWTATLEQWRLDGADEPHLTLVAPATVTIGSEQLRLTPACLAENDKRLCAQGSLDADGSWEAKASAERLPLKTLGQGLPGRPEFEGYLAMQFEASGKPGHPWSGTGRVELNDAALHYPLEHGKLQTLTIGEGHAEFTAATDRFSGTMKFRATEKAFVDADITLARVPDRALADQALTGALRAKISELGLLPLFVTEVDRVDGTLATELTIGGSPRAPNIDGTLQLVAKAIDLYQINLQLRDTRLDARLTGNSLTLDGTSRAGTGQATIKGKLAWIAGQPSGELKLTGEKLRVVDIPEVHIVASPDLAMRISGRRIDVDGTVTVPYARIAPVQLIGAVLPSSDEVIIGARVTPPEERFQVYSRVRLTLGDDVRIDTYGLVGKLSGSVTATANPGDPGTGVGELKVDDGEYTVLARRLDIDRGRLVYSGGPLSNPGIDIRAIRKLPDILVGADVRGTLREPTLSFFSEPVVAQAQIVSLLIAGGTLESLESNQAKQVGNARNLLAAQGGAILASQLGAQLGLESDVTIETNEQSQTSLVLGKYLSPRLYVSYGVSLTESINTLKLEYTIGDRWTIKTEAGENRSADIVYTID
jgi:translocation and assembly module TamB